MQQSALKRPLGGPWPPAAAGRQKRAARRDAEEPKRDSASRREARQDPEERHPLEVVEAAVSASEATSVHRKPIKKPTANGVSSAKAQKKSVPA